MAEDKPEQAQEKPKRGKKINKMSVAEIEKALSDIVIIPRTKYSIRSVVNVITAVDFLAKIK